MLLLATPSDSFYRIKGDTDSYFDQNIHKTYTQMVM